MLLKYIASRTRSLGGAELACGNSHKAAVWNIIHQDNTQTITCTPNLRNYAYHLTASYYGCLQLYALNKTLLFVIWTIKALHLEP